MKPYIALLSIAVTSFVGCSTIPEPPELTNEEYEIFSLVLQSEWRLQDSVTCLISDSTYVNSIALFEIPARTKTEIEYSKDELSSGFRTRNARRYCIEPNRFTGSFRIVPVERSNEWAWGRYKEEHGDVRGVFRFSRIGFNSERTQAVLRTIWIESSVAAGGFTVFFVKTNGRWVVDTTTARWTS